MRTRRTASQAALDLLARRDHFRRELEEKLQSRGFDDEEVTAALARCAELGLVDDERVAARFVEVRAAERGWGPRRLAVELMKRGVGAADAERMAGLDAELGEQAMRMALRRIESRVPLGWWRDGQRRARMVSSLIARGFEAETAIAAVSELAARRENDHHAPDDQ